jgi:hypothetical protein
MPVHNEEIEKPDKAVYSDIKLEKPDNVELVSEAKIAAEEDLNMGLWDVVKLYAKTVVGPFCSRLSQHNAEFWGTINLGTINLVRVYILLAKNVPSTFMKRLPLVPDCYCEELMTTSARSMRRYLKPFAGCEELRIRSMLEMSPPLPRLL